MIVVADTSPLNYLILIDQVGVLPKLFGRVLIPEAVATELRNPRSPIKVRRWAEQMPIWLEVHAAPEVGDPMLRELGAGERDAIQVALRYGIKRVLIDEYRGRAVATELSLQVEGTLGILEHTANLKTIDFRQAFHQLEGTNFRLSASIRALFLSRNM